MFERIGELWLERKRPAAPRPTPLLLVHGMWGGSWYWGPLLRRLAAAGWDAWALNLRGHHGSDPAADVSRLGLVDYVDDVARCVAALGEVVLIGHSMGGLVAQKAAEGAGIAAAAFLMSAPPRGIGVLRWPLLSRLGPYAPALLGGRPFVPRRADADALLFNALPADVRRDAYARLVPESGRAAREIALGRLAVDAGRLRAPTLPTLVVGAAGDAITPPAIQRRIARKYGSAYRELPGHAHMAMLEDDGAALADLLVEWLAGRFG